MDKEKLMNDIFKLIKYTKQDIIEYTKLKRKDYYGGMNYCIECDSHNYFDYNSNPYEEVLDCCPNCGINLNNLYMEKLNYEDEFLKSKIEDVVNEISNVNTKTEYKYVTSERKLPDIPDSVLQEILKAKRQGWNGEDIRLSEDERRLLRLHGYDVEGKGLYGFSRVSW